MSTQTTQKRELELSSAEETTLVEMRDHHGKPHIRERAAALLKIAAGKSVNWVAQEGLLHEHKWDTVKRLRNGGISGTV